MTECKLNFVNKKNIFNIRELSLQKKRQFLRSKSYVCKPNYHLQDQNRKFVKKEYFQGQKTGFVYKMNICKIKNTYLEIKETLLSSKKFICKQKEHFQGKNFIFINRNITCKIKTLSF